jgi:threonine aldolase
MLLFHNDYNETCHNTVLDKIAAYSSVQMPGYGLDQCCENASDLIRKACRNENLAVHFLVGGTQTNLTVISASLRPHQAVLSAYSGHINVHETGAVEATGHKIVPVPSDDGKLTAEQVEKYVNAQRCDDSAEHTAQIKMVYISQSTELGTLYTLSELESISAVCRKYGLYLFVDGARLGYALTAMDQDVTLCDLARLCDVFYIGGTKCGAMFGEAVVISNTTIAEDFRYLIKRHGAMLAKGWLLGAQFEALFENGLYFDICRHANCLADQLRETLDELGYPLLIESRSNQVFPILPNDVLDKLSEHCTFMVQETVDDFHKAVRFCTSWATTQQSMDTLCTLLKEYS